MQKRAYLQVCTVTIHGDDVIHRRRCTVTFLAVVALITADVTLAAADVTLAAGTSLAAFVGNGDLQNLQYVF